jgi:hypothetical protein
MAFAHGGGAAAGAAASEPAGTEGRRAGRRVSRPGRLVAVYSYSNLESAGSADGGLEGALRRLGIDDGGAARPLLPYASGLGSGGRGSGGGGLFGTPRRAAPSPGASSSGGSGNLDAWDGSNCSSCSSPRERGHHRRTGSCPVTFGGGSGAAAGGLPPLWLRRGRGRGPTTLDVPDAALGKIEGAAVGA